MATTNNDIATLIKSGDFNAAANYIYKSQAFKKIKRTLTYKMGASDVYIEDAFQDAVIIMFENLSKPSNNYNFESEKDILSYFYFILRNSLIKVQELKKQKDPIVKNKYNYFKRIFRLPESENSASGDVEITDEDPIDFNRKALRTLIELNKNLKKEITYEEFREKILFFINQLGDICREKLIYFYENNNDYKLLTQKFNHASVNAARQSINDCRNSLLKRIH